MDNRFGWFLTVVVISALMSAISWFCLTGLNSTVDKIDYSYQTIQIIQDTLVSVVDIETGTRGFLLTSDKKFLEPYNEGLTNISKNLDSLTLITADNPGQKARLSVLKPNVKSILDLAAQAVQSKQDGLDTGSSTTKSGETKISMDAVRGILTEMRSIEEDTLKETKKNSAQKYYNIVTFSVLGVLGYSFLVAFISPLIQRKK